MEKTSQQQLEEVIELQQQLRAKQSELEIQVQQEEQIQKVRVQMKDDLVRSTKNFASLKALRFQLNHLAADQYTFVPDSQSKLYELQDKNGQAFFSETQSLPKPIIIHNDTESTIAFRDLISIKPSFAVFDTAEGIRFEISFGSESIDDNKSIAVMINDRIQNLASERQKRKRFNESYAQLIKQVQQQYPEAIISRLDQSHIQVILPSGIVVFYELIKQQGGYVLKHYFIDVDNLSEQRKDQLIDTFKV